MNQLNNDSLLEKLAELEHKQWAHWTAHMLKNLTYENVNRWRKQIGTLYSELSEKEKESDREWAKKVIEILENKEKELIGAVKDPNKRSQMKTEKLKMPLMYDVIALTCDCGKKFILLEVENDSKAYQQEITNFCPFCGKEEADR